MKKLATLLRAGQLFAHNAHNSARGDTFFEDHEFFGETYAAIESAYDDVVERGIGLGSIKTDELVQIQKDAVALVPLAESCKEMFYTQLRMDNAVCAEIEGLCVKGGLSQGTQNLLQGIADTTEKRCTYLIKRKLLK